MSRTCSLFMIAAASLGVGCNANAATTTLGNWGGASDARHDADSHNSTEDAPSEEEPDSPTDLAVGSDEAEPRASGFEVQVSLFTVSATGAVEGSRGMPVVVDCTTGGLDRRVDTPLSVESRDGYTTVQTRLDIRCVISEPTVLCIDAEFSYIGGSALQRAELDACFGDAGPLELVLPPNGPELHSVGVRLDALEVLAE